MSDTKDQAGNPPERMPLTSMDVTEALLTQLREAVPQVFSEGSIDYTKLRAALGEHIETGAERYGLNWAGKRDAFRNVQIPSVATLRPQPEESVNWDSTENLIIEGDNLEVLKLLQKPYHGKVKMIYIDPPYNTGNEFIYPDNYREGLDEYLRYTGQLTEEGTAASTNKDTSGRYHSNWLNMMYPRLFLARSLLKEDGVIFVSIDDHEVHNLRLLMDEVFGEENFVAQVEWQKRYTRSNNTDNFTSVIDHLCIYQRSDTFNVKLLARDETANSRFTNPDNDPRGPWKATPFLNQVAPERRPNLCYPITNPYTGHVENPTTKAWRYEKSVYEKLLSEDRLYWGKEKDRRVPDIKTFLSEVREGMTPINFWSHQYAGHTDMANNEIKQLFDIKVFDTPKPTLLVKRMIEHSCDQEDIILDFFAGSGTTAHAVLAFNQEHGTRHKFILVQLPEPISHEEYENIAAITRERVRRVVKRIHDEVAGQISFDGLLDDLGFKAFQLGSSNFKIWQESAEQTADKFAEQLQLYADNVRAGRTEQDRLYEIILKSGRPLSVKVEKITVGEFAAHSVDGGALLVCLEPQLTNELLRTLLAHRPQLLLCLDTAFAGNDSLKTNIVLEAKAHDVIFRTV